MDQATLVVIIGLIGVAAMVFLRYRPQQTRQARSVLMTQGVAHAQWQQFDPALREELLALYEESLREELLALYEESGSETTFERLRAEVKLPPSTLRAILDLIRIESMRRRRDQLLEIGEPASPSSNALPAEQPHEPPPV